MRHCTLCFLMLLLVLPACGQGPPPSGTPAPLPAVLTLRHVAVHPHDTKAFTQGLLFRDGMLYESTGQYGASSLRCVDVVTGAAKQKLDIPREYFAEGLECAGDLLYLLTWREKKCFVFDRKTLERRGEFAYDGEGWGLCYDGKSLILSDGTAILRFYDPKTFKQTGKVSVYDGPTARRGRPVVMLNELEYVHGEVWANVWREPRIVRIDPKSGRVLGWIDLSGFVPKGLDPHGEHVLNGIAFDPATDRLYLTGKYWPSLHELQIEDDR